LTKITKSFEFEAPPEKVWAFMSDLEKINELGKGFVEFKQTSKRPMGVGTTMHWISKAGGSQVESDMEITEFEKNKKLTMRTMGASKFKMQQTATLEPTANGTKVTYIADYTMPYSILGKIVDKLRVRKETEKSLEKQASELKKALEK
jgi:carbon monoxide dehydrogenase subunit G